MDIILYYCSIDIIAITNDFTKKLNAFTIRILKNTNYIKLKNNTIKVHIIHFIKYLLKFLI